MRNSHSVAKNARAANNVKTVLIRDKDIFGREVYSGLTLKWLLIMQKRRYSKK